MPDDSSKHLVALVNQNARATRQAVEDMERRALAAESRVSQLATMMSDLARRIEELERADIQRKIDAYTRGSSRER